MATALAGNDPTMCSKASASMTVSKHSRPAACRPDMSAAFGQAAVRRERRCDDADHRPSLYPALEAAVELAAHGIEAEIIDARTLVPFDYDTLCRFGAPDRAADCVSEAVERGSLPIP